MSPDQFDARMCHLRSTARPILPLQEAIQKLRDDNLDPGTVAVTIDDGWASTSLMFEILERHRIPATLYMTTWYMNKQAPIIGKAREFLSSVAPKLRLPPNFPELSLEDQVDALKTASLEAGIALDWYHGRQFHLMSGSEMEALAKAGLDIQLHTHRHRLSENIQKELSDNRDALKDAGISPSDLRHFCYPSGIQRADAPQALKAWGVESATTCVSGLATKKSDPYRLPRFLDGRSVSEAEFDGFLSGFVPLLDSARVRLGSKKA